ncbi:MAG: hypothetical protein NZM31_02945 [Gemmatales bacterium]|nr:hypothetical protein [Gemmatales bacterium]MDW8385958.1 hypothetical protein [Gemmatales bacterium]
MQYHVLLERIASGLAEWAAMIAPLMLYLLLLARVVYRHRHPVVLSGTSNLAAVWFGVSGFLLFGPPSWIVYPFIRYGPFVYWTAYGGYILFLLLAALVTIGRQRNCLVIFNLSPRQVGTLLPEVLTSLGVSYEAVPGRLSLADGKLVLDLETSPVWNHAVLTWYGSDEELRRKIEAELRSRLAAEPVTDSHPQRLMLVLALSLLVFLIFALLVIRLFHPSL